MSSLKIEIQNLPSLQKKLANLAADTEKKVVAALKEFGTETVRDAITFAPVDEAHLRSSISYTLTRNGSSYDVEIVVATDYAAYMEFGTRSFAQAYVASLPSDWQTFAATFRGGGGGSLEEMLMRLTQWVMRKGFAAYRTKSGNVSRSKNSVTAQESAAYIIALRILQNGVRAHPFLYPAIQKNKPILINNLHAILNAA